MGNQVLPQRHFRRNMLDISRFFFFFWGLVEVDLPKISQDVMGCRRNMEGNDFARHPSGSTWSFPCPTSTPVAASTRWGYGWLSWMSRVSMTEIDDFSQRANGLHWFWGFSSRLCMWNNQMVEVMLKVSNPSVFQPGQALKYVSFAVQMLGKSFKMPPGASCRKLEESAPQMMTISMGNHGKPLEITIWWSTMIKSWGMGHESDIVRYQDSYFEALTWKFWDAVAGNKNIYAHLQRIPFRRIPYFCSFPAWHDDSDLFIPSK